MAQNEQQLLAELESYLEPDEQIIAHAFGLQGLGNQTERWLLILGLYVLGSLLIIIFSDRMYLVLTNQRLILVTLSPKYLNVLGFSSFPASTINEVSTAESGIYRIINMTSLGRSLRFRFPKAHFNFPEQGQRVTELIQQLQITQNSTTDAERALDAAAQQIVQESLTTQAAKANKHYLISLLIWFPLMFLGMLVSAVIGGSIVGDFNQASTTTIFLMGAITFLLIPILAWLGVRGVVKALF